MNLLVELEPDKHCKCFLCHKNKAQHILMFFWNEFMSDNTYRKSIEGYCDNCYIHEMYRCNDWFFVTKTFFDRYTSKYEINTRFTDRTI